MFFLRNFTSIFSHSRCCSLKIILLRHKKQTPLFCSIANEMFHLSNEKFAFKLRWLTIRHLYAAIYAASICFNALQLQLTFIALLEVFNYCDCSKEFTLLARTRIAIMHAMIMHSNIMLLSSKLISFFLLMILSFIHNHHS